MPLILVLVVLVVVVMVSAGVLEVVVPLLPRTVDREKATKLAIRAKLNGFTFVSHASTMRS